MVDGFSGIFLLVRKGKLPTYLLLVVQDDYCTCVHCYVDAKLTLCSPNLYLLSIDIHAILHHKVLGINSYYLR